MNKNNLLGIVLLGVTIFLSTGCSSDKASKDSSNTDSKATALSIIHIDATSNHYIDIALNRKLTPQELDTMDLSIISSSGKPLAINQKTLDTSGSNITLETDTQAPEKYQLRYKPNVVNNNQAENIAASAKPSSVHSKINTRATIDATYDFVEFQGSIAPEPYIETVIATSNTSLLITMSDSLDKASVEKIGSALTNSYRIVAADNSRPREDVGDLVVTAAVLDNSDKAKGRIVLTTSTQSDIEYYVLLTNLYSASSGKLIHPARNKMSFFGMAPVDTKGPTLVKAVSTGNTGVLLYFSEPLNDTAAQPGNFSICATNFDNGLCPAGSVLNITSAELQAQNTLLALTTLSQQSGIDYTGSRY